MVMEYFDKNGEEIKTGMRIKHDGGDIEMVYQNSDENDLGIDASNKNFIGGSDRKIYPLYQFNLKEWIIIK
jgi:hypothetical protein